MDHPDIILANLRTTIRADWCDQIAAAFDALEALKVVLPIVENWRNHEEYAVCVQVRQAVEAAEKATSIT